MRNRAFHWQWKKIIEYYMYIHLWKRPFRRLSPINLFTPGIVTSTCCDTHLWKGSFRRLFPVYLHPEYILPPVHRATSWCFRFGVILMCVAPTPSRTAIWTQDLECIYRKDLHQSIWLKTWQIQPTKPKLRHICPVFYRLLTQYHVVFALAQLSARQVKAW